jgi:hypothetical protein
MPEINQLIKRGLFEPQYPHYVSQLSITVINAWDKSTYKERFILAHSFRVSVYDWLVPLLWTCGSTVHHGRSAWWRKSFHLVASHKNEKEEKVGVPQSSLGTHSQWPKTSHYVPPPLACNTWTCRNIPDPNCSTHLPSGELVAANVSEKVGPRVLCPKTESLPSISNSWSR